MKIKQLKTLSLAIGLVLTTACNSNPVKPPALPMPDCPRYVELDKDEIGLLNDYCKKEKFICPIHRSALMKLFQNHQRANACILQHKGIIESTR